MLDQFQSSSSSNFLRVITGVRRATVSRTTRNLTAFLSLEETSSILTVRFCSRQSSAFVLPPYPHLSHPPRLIVPTAANIQPRFPTHCWVSSVDRTLNTTLYSDPSFCTRLRILEKARPEHVWNYIIWNIISNNLLLYYVIIARLVNAFEIIFQMTCYFTS